MVLDSAEAEEIIEGAQRRESGAGEEIDGEERKSEDENDDDDFEDEDLVGDLPSAASQAL